MIQRGHLRLVTPGASFHDAMGSDPKVTSARRVLAAQAGDVTALRGAVAGLLDVVAGFDELVEVTCATAFMRGVEHRDAAREALS